jgi:hypothetical protein
VRCPACGRYSGKESIIKYKRARLADEYVIMTGNKPYCAVPTKSLARDIITEARRQGLERPLDEHDIAAEEKLDAIIESITSVHAEEGKEVIMRQIERQLLAEGLIEFSPDGMMVRLTEKGKLLRQQD